MNLAPLWRQELHTLLQDLRCFYLEIFALPQYLSFPSKCRHSFWVGFTSVKKDVLCRCPSIPIKDWTKVLDLSEEISLNLDQSSIAKKLVCKEKETLRTQKRHKMYLGNRDKIAWKYNLRPNDNKLHLQKLTNKYLFLSVYLSICISKVIEVNELSFVVESWKLNWHN